MMPTRSRYEALALKRDCIKRYLDTLARLPQDTWALDEAETCRQRLTRINAELRRCLDRRQQRALLQQQPVLWWLARHHEKRLQAARYE